MRSVLSALFWGNVDLLQPLVLDGAVAAGGRCKRGGSDTSHPLSGVRKISSRAQEYEGKPQ